MSSIIRGGQIIISLSVERYTLVNWFTMETGENLLEVSPEVPRDNVTATPIREVSHTSVHRATSFEDVIGCSKDAATVEKSSTLKKKTGSLKKMMSFKKDKDKKDEEKGDDDSTNVEGKGKVGKMLYRVQTKASKVFDKLTPFNKDDRSSSVAAAESMSDEKTKTKNKTLRRIASGISSKMSRSSKDKTSAPSGSAHVTDVTPLVDVIPENQTPELRAKEDT